MGGKEKGREKKRRGPYNTSRLSLTSQKFYCLYESVYYKQIYNKNFLRNCIPLFGCQGSNSGVDDEDDFVKLDTHIMINDFLSQIVF